MQNSLLKARFLYLSAIKPSSRGRLSSMLMWLYNSCQGYVSEEDLNFILSVWLNYKRLSHLATHKSSLIITCAVIIFMQATRCENG